MKIKLILSSKDVSVISSEVVSALEVIRANAVDVDQPCIFDLEKDMDGNAWIYFNATMSPEQIERALHVSGYEENGVVGVNNMKDEVLFQDDVNDMYLIAGVSLELKNGVIHGEYLSTSDEHNFAMFTDF